MRKALLVLMLLAAVASAVLAPLAEVLRPQRPHGINRYLFFPSKYPNGDWTAEGLGREDVYFTSADGTRLHGWYCLAEKTGASIILWAHGNAGNVASRVDLLKHLRQHSTVFVFDYRGYGRSDGSPTIDGVLMDARAARAILRRKAEVTDSEMILMGESIGGAIAVQLAAESSSKALVLQSTFSNLQQLAAVHYGDGASVVPQDMLNSINQIKRCRTNLLQSHGSQDRTITYEHGMKLFEAA